MDKSTSGFWFMLLMSVAALAAGVSEFSYTMLTGALVVWALSPDRKKPDA